MKHNITYYILLAALVLTACSKDDDLTGQPISDNSSIISFGLNSGGWQNGRPDTRAAQISDGTPTTAQPENIGVWGYYMTKGAYGKVGDPIPNDYKVADIKEGGNSRSGHYESLSNYLFTAGDTHTPLTDGQTHYSKGNDDINNPSGSFPWEAQKYMFYCYAPHISEPAGNVPQLLSSISPETPFASGDPSNAATGINYIKFPNVSSISNTDVVIAQQRRPWYRLQNANEPSVGYGACVNFTDDGYQLQHIYAAVQFCFALHEDYAKIRYLHIKEVQITSEYELGKMVTYTVTKDVTAVDGTIIWSPTVQTSSAPTLTLAPRIDNNKFILGTSYVPFDTNIEAGHDYTDRPMTDATNKYFSYGWLYIAARDNKEIKADGSYDSSKLKKFRLTVTYDVYDRKGACTRKNVMVSNDLSFPASVTRFEAGKYYNAYIKINPDFLYVLSDKDNTADVVLKAGS